MECASRGLAFYSYQSSQEIIYQEHLAKSLTDKYTVLSQQMDQLIRDANAQIKALQDKIRSVLRSFRKRRLAFVLTVVDRHDGRSSHA
jgi:E3 ubiquitin-protein ligase CCNP1IP1